MKTTILSLALGLASLTFAQTPAPATTPAPSATKPAPAATKSTKKHAKKAAKKTVKANPASSVPAPAK